MADRMTTLAKKGQWSKYKGEAKKLWKAYAKTYRLEGEGLDGTEGIGDEALVLMANRLPVELWIEPAVWNAAREKAGSDARLKATLRELLKLWLDGEVDPWEA